MSGKQGVPAKYYTSLGFRTKAEGIKFASENNINVPRMSRIFAKKQKYLEFKRLIRQKLQEYAEDEYYRDSIRPRLREFVRDPRENSVEISSGEQIEYRGVMYDYYLTSKKIGGMMRFLLDKVRRDVLKGHMLLMQLIYIDSKGERHEGRHVNENNEVVKYLTVTMGAAKSFEDKEEDDDGWEYNPGVGMMLQSVIFLMEKKRNKNNRVEGAFFPYNLKKDGDYENLKDLNQFLSRYQISTESDYEDQENCFVNCLILSELLSESEIESFKLKCRSSLVSQKTIRDLAEEKKIKITVFTPTQNGKRKKIQHGPKTSKVELNLGLIENHYFIIESTEIATYSLKNYLDVKDEDEWWKISKNDNGRFKREKGRGADSYTVIRTLVNEGSLLKPITMSQMSINHRNLASIDLANIDLDNSEEEEGYKPIAINEKKKDTYEGLEDDKWDDLKKHLKKIGGKIDVKIAFDFESTTDGDLHIPYLVCYEFYVNNEKTDKTRSMVGDGCELDFLDDISSYADKLVVGTAKKYGVNLGKSREDYKTIMMLKNKCFNFTLYAHNITYDIHFLVKHVKGYNPVNRAGTNVCGGSFFYKGTRFLMKDTLAIITFGLAKFKDIFKLDDKEGKEVMPYEFYNRRTVNADVAPIATALRYVKEEDREKFLQNIKDWDLMEGKENFDHIEYSKIYCKRDVDVMMRGYFTFRSWVLEQLNIDIDSKLTISSLSDEYFKRQGCYEDCYYINGVARYFIQKSVIGGRCMSAKNKQYNITNRRLNDFDAVSLYPSAMKRLSDDLGGYLKGTPKMLTKRQRNMKFLNKQSGYFVEVRIDRVPEDSDFPLISYVNDKGVREFTTDLEKNNIYHFNKISLEDAIEHHSLGEDDFEIIKGYYFNEGRNNKIGETIEGVFNMRLKKKAEKCASETLYKLIMNSSYGKTIMKEQSTKLVYKDNKEEFLKYVSRNYNHIREAVNIKGCDKWLITENKSIVDHFNACHIGSEILAMSKRIMNEVMTLAESNGIDIYYQDTDSMHIRNGKVAELAKLFKEKYDRDLIGKNMGQFHCDFEPYKGKEAKWACKTIILGKKSYYDKVYYGDDENGNPIYHDHFRMKGIPSNVVVKTAQGMGDDVMSDIEALYEHLYNGNTVTFNLLACGVKFVKSKDSTIKNAIKFERSLCFRGKEDDETQEIEVNE